MKVGVVGAGPSGLCAIKHSLSFGCEVIAFEQADKIGGVWNYTDEIDKDKYGLEIHSSLYRGLITNLPKEVMSFPELPFQPLDRSFIKSEEVLTYINRYAETSDLCRYVKLEHHVLRIRPLFDDKWEFIVKNLKAEKYETLIFDAVFICVAFPVPILPNIPGRDVFKGKQIHAHVYRDARHYENEKVLVIGGGPSGCDISLQAGMFTEKLIWSNHMLASFGKKLHIKLPASTIEKPDVKKFTESGVEFVDGSFEEISTVIYATGYDFKYPFLSVDCGLQSGKKYVRPLYKHCININHPSMAIIGLPFFALGVPMFDLQIRFCLTYMTRRKLLPTRDEMLKETEEDMKERWKKLPKHKAHFMGIERHVKYYEDLAQAAEIEAIKPVLSKMFNYTIKEMFEHFESFRNLNFKIIDDETFEVC